MSAFSVVTPASNASSEYRDPSASDISDSLRAMWVEERCTMVTSAPWSQSAAQTTVRGEVRRLRQLTGLSIESQPYSLASHERRCVDFLSVEHPGEFLPDSEIPAINDLRYGI